MVVRDLEAAVDVHVVPAIHVAQGLTHRALRLEASWAGWAEVCRLADE